MNKVLYVESSPRKERSASIMVAKEFLRQYRAVHTSDTVETLDLWSEKLPAFDGDVINAKYRILHGQPHTPAESRAWEVGKPVAVVYARGGEYTGDAKAKALDYQKSYFET